ncbi:MAG: hypothetical protein L0Y61_07720 [Epsilonproteobacteria bacterium]|nr:hypothetical protein [Campylobacterota bacterium]
MKKESMIFVGIFLFLAIGMHFKEWTSHPIEHLLSLPNAGAYGLGAIHPLIFTIFGYLVFVSFRAIQRLIIRKK